MQPLIHTRHPNQLLETIPPDVDLLVVDVGRQKIGGWIRGERLWPAPVSTGLAGFGNLEDSGQTPLGWHLIKEVIGVGQSPGQAYHHRLPIGDPLPPADWQAPEQPEKILSRILRLDGQTPGLNDRTFARYIYIHGTNQEQDLGRPVSKGCVRMPNQILADWADALAKRECRVWLGTLREPLVHPVSNSNNVKF